MTTKIVARRVSPSGNTVGYVCEMSVESLFNCLEVGEHFYTEGGDHNTPATVSIAHRQDGTSHLRTSWDRTKENNLEFLPEVPA